MSQFYGNMKNNSRTSFIFDKIYPTRTAMEMALNAVDNDNNPIGDGIFVNRYVLVDYHYALMDPIITQDNIDQYYTEVDNSIVTIQNFRTYYIKEILGDGTKVYSHPTHFQKDENTKYYQKTIFIEKYQNERSEPQADQFDSQDEPNQSDVINSTNVFRETDLYYAHRYLDWENYRASYDCTVWMKIYADNKERYIMVAELDAKAPILEFIDDAPSCQNGSGHFDSRMSTDLNYVYFMPSNWNMVLNKYTPNSNNITPRDSTKDDEYWYYQDDKNSNELWYEDYVLTSDTTVQSGKDYFEITFQAYNTEVGQSIKNLHCYIPKYVPAAFDAATSYELIDGRYVRVQGQQVAEKTYYTKIDNEYMAAEESVALEDVQYFRITKIKRAILLTGENISSSGYYELNNQRKTFDDTVEYPYFNKEGFDPKVSTHVSTKGQGVFIKPVPSTQIYPQHKFVHVGVLTASTYLPNRYYTYIGKKTQVPAGHIYDRDHAYYGSKNGNDFSLIPLILNDNGVYTLARGLDTGESCYYDEDLNNINYFAKSTTWQPNAAYYEITCETDAQGTRIMDHEDDTYRVDIYLPELGNTVADIYDIIYGAPKVVQSKNDGYNNIIGYCSQEQWISYEAQLEGDYWAGSKIFNLSQEQFDALSPELYPGLYDIPVYAKTGSNIRPYNQARLDSTLAPPYDNLQREDVSFGWSLTLLKRYLSELRQLAYGNNGEGGIGLQSDWTLDDQEGFGYIQHRPNLITTFVPTKDTVALPNKEYFREYIENGEVIYKSLSPGYRVVSKENYIDPAGTPLANVAGSDNKFYYKDVRPVYQLISNITAKERAAIDTKDTSLKKPRTQLVNAANFIDYYITQDEGQTYRFPTEWDSSKTYFDFVNVTIDDYNNLGWRSRRQRTEYYEITANTDLSNYSGDYYVLLSINDADYNENNIIDEDNNHYRLFSEQDLIGKYCDLDAEHEGLEEITIENYMLVGNKNVYITPGGYNAQTETYDNPIRFQYIGYYYSGLAYVYEPITDISYEQDSTMYVQSNNEYIPVTYNNYINNNFYFATEAISYIQVQNENYNVGQTLYIKKSNNTYEQITWESYADQDLYVYNPNEKQYFKIVTGETGDINNRVINYNDINFNSSLYTYQDNTVEGSVILKENDVIANITRNQFTVFELPKTYSNGLEELKNEYVQCSSSSVYDENTQYWIRLADGTFDHATYPILNQSIEPISAGNTNGQITREFGYQMTIDANQHVIQRVYSGFIAETSQDEISLFYNFDENGQTIGKSINEFSIITENDINNNILDAPEISDELSKFDASNDPRLSKYEVYNILNAGSENDSLVNKYGAKYRIDSIHTNWPIREIAEDAEDNIVGLFYYAKLKSSYSSNILDQEHFLLNPTDYYTLQEVPITQEDYEIHNIWTEVLTKTVLLEP